MNRTLKLMGSGFVYGLTHPFDSELKGRPVDDLSITEALLDGAACGVGAGVTQLAIQCAATVAILIGIGYVHSKLESLPVNVNTTVDQSKEK